MAIPQISVRHPKPHDIVDDPVEVAGVGTGFEGTLQARLRNAAGDELAQKHSRPAAPASGATSSSASTSRASRTAPRGTLEVFEISAKDGSEINKRVIPIVFGRALVDPYTASRCTRWRPATRSRRSPTRSRRRGEVPDHLRRQPRPARRPRRDRGRPGAPHPPVGARAAGLPGLCLAPRPAHAGRLALSVSPSRRAAPAPRAGRTRCPRRRRSAGAPPRARARAGRAGRWSSRRTRRR